VGDDVEILPAGLSCKVRGLQVHGSKADKAEAGVRLAVNLQGVEHTEVLRGDTVVPKGLYRPTRAVDIRLNYLKSAPRELKHRSTMRLHSATYEVPAKVILFDRDTLQPGDSAYAQLRLERPVLLLPGDPFVLRTYSPQATLGGGSVLDPSPPRRRRRSSEAMELLQAVESGNDSEKIRLMIRTSLLSGLSLEELMSRTGMSAKKIDAALGAILTAGEAVQMVKDPRIFISREAFDTLKGRLYGEVQNYLRDNAMKDGISKEELKSRIPRRSDPRFFGPVLAVLEKEQKVVPDRDIIKLPGRKGEATLDQAEFQGKIEKLLLTGGTEPPTIKELCDALDCTEKLLLEHLAFLVKEGRAVKIKSDMFYAPAPLAELQEKLITLIRERGEITPPEFREVCNLSRKFMIPVMEYFDSMKVTIRVGDKRVLRRG
jgi:selenocysteine-specific elongation factor